MAKIVYKQRPTDDEALHHKLKKLKQYEARKKILATKKIEKGLFIIMTGTGKGKTTSAMGLVLRSLAYDKKIAIVQFVKGVWNTGEVAVLKKFNNVEFTAMGEGFSWDTRDLQRDWDAARKAWKYCEHLLNANKHDLLVFDEINIVIRSGLLEASVVKDAIISRPKKIHVVCTGRNADQILMDSADTVTEMKSIKHHFRSGVITQKMIEY